MTISRIFRSPSILKRIFDGLNRTGNSVFFDRSCCGSKLRITREMSDLQL